MYWITYCSELLSRIDLFKGFQCLCAGSCHRLLTHLLGGSSAQEGIPTLLCFSHRMCLTLTCVAGLTFLSAAPSLQAHAGTCNVTCNIS